MTAGPNLHLQIDCCLNSDNAAVNQREISPFLETEYSLAHGELRELWSLYWKQASYFLTFNGALLAFVSNTISSPNRPIIPALILCSFGSLLSVVWLFHGNRYFYYIRTIEARMRLIEKDARFEMRLQQYKNGEVGTRLPPAFLERYSGARLRNTSLPMLTLAIWLGMIFYVVDYLGTTPLAAWH